MIGRRRLALLTAGGLVAAAFTPAQRAWAAPTPPGQPTYFLLVFSDPVAGQEDAYARWFAEPHLHGMAAVPGVISVQHWVDAGVVLRRAPRKQPPDLIVYTIQTDAPEQVKDALTQQAEAGSAWPGPAIASLSTVTFRALEPRNAGAGGEPADAKPGDVGSYLVLAFLDSVAGQDEAFNTWYDTIHEPELLANRGVVSGLRSARSDVQMAPSDIPSQYLMQMSVITSDLPAVFRQMLTGGPPPPSLDRTRGYGFNYRAAAPPV